jgi:hypothetical protein
MELNLMDMYQVESKVHGKRFEILQHYLFLYGETLKGKKNRYEKFNNEEVLASSREGIAIQQTLMTVQKDEEELGKLLERYGQIMDNTQ